jgi:hypothetical protein
VKLPASRTTIFILWVGRPAFSDAAKAFACVPG